jgi:hypothetical protein
MGDGLRFSPKPKAKRIEDKKVLRYVVQKRDGICMVGLALPGKYGPCSAGLDPHHIINQGAGGDDTKENLITLCRYHHDLAQSKRIPVEELRGILTKYFRYDYGAIPEAGRLP